jgi:PTS system cellobiose-specific IIC component
LIFAGRQKEFIFPSKSNFIHHRRNSLLRLLRVLTMSKVIDSLEKVLLPFAVKIGKQPHINAIKNGFIKLMPLTLAGAMFVLINNVFLSFGEGSFFYSWAFAWMPPPLKP